MATFEEFQAALARRQGDDNLKEQFYGPRETMGQAVKADTSGLAGLDFTNPANLMNILHHGLPIAAQVAGTAAVGPEAGPLMKMLGSGVGSMLGYGYQSGVEPALKGQPSTMSPGGALANFGLGALTEGGVQAGGGLGRIVSGKSVALSEGEKAAQGQLSRNVDVAEKATGEAMKAAESAGAKVQSAQDAINTEMMKHSDKAFAGVKEAEVERMVKEGLGPKAVVQQPVTIESLTADTKIPQKVAQRGVQGVFDGISAKYDQAIEPYGELPIPSPSVGSAVRTIRETLQENKMVVGAKLGALMDEIAGPKKSINLSRGPVGRFGAADIGPTSLKLMTPEQRNAIMAARGVKNAGISTDNPITVQEMIGYKNQLMKIVRTSKDAVERRTAANVVDAIRSDIGKVMPEEMKPVLASLDDEWHQARSTFSDAFRSRLFRASSPEQVAEAIYTGAKTGKQMGHRSSLLVNQIAKEAPDQLPPLRSAFATMVANSPNAAAEIQKMPPSLFKSLFPGTGFDNPKNWVQALQGQNVFRQIAGSPELLAKYNSIFQQGMSSLGTKLKEAALQEAQATLRAAPDSRDLIAKALREEPTTGEAFKAGAMGGMRQPMIGKGMDKYIEHRGLYHLALAMAGGGAYTSHYGLAIPLGYLASTKGMGYILSKPTIARMYYNALTSKTAEQMMFWAGRLTAAGLAETARSRP